MASSSSNQTTAVSYTFLTPIKLDRSNYMIWKMQVLASIQGNGLEGYIDGSITAPYSDQRIPNSEFVIWKRTDQQLLGWLLSSMTESVLGIVLGCKTSFEVWRALEKLSGSQNKTRALQLKNQMMMTKKNDLSVYDYFHKMKSIADIMAAAGAPMSDYDFMISVLGGIGSEFNPVAVLITGRGLDLDLSESLSMLMTHKGMLEQQALAETMDANLAFAANFVKKGNNKKKGGMFYRGRKGGKGNNMYGGRSWNQGGRTQMPGNFSQPYQPRCQVCFTIGHTADICKDRFNKDFTPAMRYPHQSNYNQGFNQGYNQRSMSAYMATPETVMDDGWYLDSGATHHLTNDLSNINISEPYEESPFSTDSMFSKQPLNSASEYRHPMFKVFSVSVPLPDPSSSSDNIIHQFQMPATSASSSSSSSSSPFSQPTHPHHLSSHNSLSISHNSPHHHQSPNPAPLPTHPMLTRAKTGVFKPKFLAYSSVLGEQEPAIVSQALSDSKWKTAMQIEYNALMENQTWTLVPASQATKIVGCKWVFRIKYNADGSVSKYKAWLVAKGFHQTPGIDYFETFSSVVKQSTVRIILSLTVMKGWKIRQIDINNAFLNGELNEDVYMFQPEGFVQSPSGHVYSSLFIKHESGGIVIVLVYVDDILITGDNNTIIETFIKYLGDTFALKDLGEFSYFLGIKVTHTATGRLHLSQAKYVRDLLTRTDMENCRESDTPMSTGQKLRRAGNDDNLIVNVTEYRSIIGALQYLVLTRPELAFSVNKLSQFLAAPTEKHWIACKKILRYLKATKDFGLLFKAGDGINLTSYTDADWACDVDDRKSVGAYCVYLGQNLISWSSKKQQTVARSSTESEYRALSTACAEIVWIQALLGELKLKCSQIPVIWCDNNGAAALATNPVYHAKTKHIEFDVHFIREKVTCKQVEIKYVPSEWNVADVLTKPMAYSFFNYYRDKLNVVPRPLSLRRGVEMISQQQQIKG
ncbi:retrovirus-related pol polyprotein from transposon RE1 [Citrus sinensis]|uniref:Retrovirus-related pol polyprotein from transposon RE1 n=1 Tax=Citrus sinensis TaxID=2711 RepID=A0ACB8NSZ8_CITSI|nr:retrovirus-related pol polyprotein from transposon RE1 [Citrus sinensis]